MADAAPAAAAAPSQEDYILGQFAASKKKLQQAQSAQQDQAQVDLDRRVAAGGMTGGSETKAIENSQRGIAGQYAGAQADLEGQKNQQLQQVQATKEAQQFQTGERQATQQFTAEQNKAVQDFQNAQRLGAQDYQSAESLLGRKFTSEERNAIQQYQTSERTGTQQFAASEAQKGRELQSEQFNKTYGLQQQQFDEAKNQFNQQMGFTLKEFNENQKTNLINAAIAMHESSIDSPGDMNAAMARLQQLLGGSAVPNATFENPQANAQLPPGQGGAPGTNPAPANTPAPTAPYNTPTPPSNPIPPNAPTTPGGLSPQQIYQGELSGGLHQQNGTWVRGNGFPLDANTYNILHSAGII